MRRVALFGVWAISLVVAFHVGGRERSDDAPAPPISIRPSVQPQAPRCAVDESATRRAVSPAMARHSAMPVVHESEPTTADSQEPEFDAEAADHAYQHGTEILDRALARGTWTRDDAGDLRLVILQLPKDQRHSLLDRLFGAVNDRRLRNDAEGAPI